MSIRDKIFNRYYKKFKEFPNLDNPQTFNEKIQWLKIYDQDPLQIVLCDKIEVKKWVAEKIGEKYVIPFYEGIPSVWKTNHDSGGVEFVNSADDEITALTRLSQRLNKKYGVNKGEWAYGFIHPKIFKEKKLDVNTDYKFHCVDGKVKFMQMVWDRNKYGKECVFDSNGNVTNLHVESRNINILTDLICTKEEFFEMKKIAEILSTNWKYVRIDLYYSNFQPWFGEITFWPNSGMAEKNRSNILLGNLLDFDLSTSKIPIVK